MTNSKSRYWFVPRKRLFLPRGITSHEGVELRRADSPVAPDIDQMVQEGRPFTILLKGFCVKDKRDNESENDLLIRSWTKYGSEPSVEALHLLKKEVPVGNQENLMSEHMFAAQEHQDENLVWIKLQILEVREALVDANIIGTSLEKIKDTLPRFGAIFPGVLPFMGEATNKASGLINNLKSLLSKDDHSDRRLVFESSLDLCVEDSGETPFRYGIYVFFKDKIEGEKYRLREYKLESSEAQLPDYMIVEVTPEIISQNGEDILVSQRLAESLPVFDEKSDNKGENFGSGNQRFRFLQSMIRKAEKLHDLIEYKKLQSLEVSEESLTQSQKKRLKKLSIELNEYLDYINEILED